MLVLFWIAPLALKVNSSVFCLDALTLHSRENEMMIKTDDESEIDKILKDGMMLNNILDDDDYNL